MIHFWFGSGFGPEFTDIYVLSFFFFGNLILPHPATRDNFFGCGLRVRVGGLPRVLFTLFFYFYVLH